MKTYYEMFGIGKAKYVVCSHDGAKTHPDGSPFFDIEIFRNAKVKAKYLTVLKRQGYQEKR